MLRNLTGYAIIAWFSVLLFAAFGWLSNLIWTFHQTTTVNVLLGVLGCLLAPIGAIHGLWVAL
jgi:hypothetical protein